jgi:cytochrome c oxidase subunit 2
MMAPKEKDASGMRTVHMDANNWAFTPSTITIKKGEKVTLELTGVSGDHGISIPDLGINQKFSAGETVSVSIPTDKTGIFNFRCNVPCGQGHRDMTGTIIIED